MPPKVITIWVGEGPDRKGKKHKPFPYAETETGFNQSVGQIKDLLERFNCERLIDYSEKAKGSDASTRIIAFEKDGLKYLIDFPTTYLENKTRKWLNMDVSGRIVFNRVKALLVDAEIEYLSFHEAMLPYLALPTPNGTMSVMEAVNSQIEGIKAGTQGLLMLPRGSR